MTGFTSTPKENKKFSLNTLLVFGLRLIGRGFTADGSWQWRGHMSLNGCVSVISIDTIKNLDLEVMTQYCKMCELNVKREHVCSNYKGSSGNMEAVGAFEF
ncbi:uncharacterized protein TNCV_1712981 [Trichonephila clavipes]|nr:uncharacterized protein TNCV_1712981 [Trichonephila clavipes]